MTWQIGPMVAVKRVDFSESVARFKRGRLDGSQMRWVLTLACGHGAVRFTPHGKPAPKRARCRLCDA